MAPNLVASLVCLLLWVLLTFIRPIGLGIVHVLLAVGAVLLVRWWGQRPVTGDGLPVTGYRGSDLPVRK